MKDTQRLTIKDLAELLDLPLVKIQRWVHQGKLPCKFKDGMCYFRHEDIRQWARDHHLVIPDQPAQAGGEIGRGTGIVSLALAVERGGFHFDLEGDDVYQVFENAVGRFPFPVRQRKSILDELLDREEIASTGIGKGVAIPHPRHVLDLGLERPSVPVAFPLHPIDFNAIDGRPVTTLFFMFSPTIHFHLELLSRLSVCLRSARFIKVLGKRKPRSILDTIRDIEAGFKKD